MKKNICLLLILPFLFSGCDDSYVTEVREESYEEGYEKGYKAGYEAGYEEGHFNGYMERESDFSPEYYSDEEIAMMEEEFEEYVQEYIEENY